MGKDATQVRKAFIANLNWGLGDHHASPRTFEASCSWSDVAVSPKMPRNGYALVFLDVQISMHQLEAKEEIVPGYEKSEGMVNLLATIQSSANLLPGNSWTGRVLIAIPTRSGYLGHTHLFRQRFIGCQELGALHDGSAFGRRINLVESQDPISFLDDCLFMLVRSRNDPQLSDEESLVEEVDARVNFPWLLDHEPRETTLVTVGAHVNLTSQLPLYRAATSLGINIVVIAHEGHWLSAPSFRHLHKAFISIDMTPDDGWHERIVAAVKSYGHVDGICGIITYYMAVAAKAAALLGMPTEPADFILCALNKYETRLLAKGYEPPATALVTNEAHLKALMVEKSFVPLYPLIVKPNFGSSSFQVHRANCETELLLAVGQVSEISGQKVVIEPYIKGPELDVNLVLLDGDLIFCEIADDFPSAGDDESATNGDFFGTALGLPSRLPANEYDIVRQKLHNLLLQIGFRTGVFHLEARVQSSSMEYSKSRDALVAPRPKTIPKGTNKEDSNPHCFLIEINPRPPGFRVVTATKSVYGVNLIDLHLLRSVGDYERMRSQATPFEPSPLFPNHARSWGLLTFLQVTEGGVCNSDDVCGDVIRRLDYADRGVVTQGICCFNRGDHIPRPQPGTCNYAAAFILMSKKYDDTLRVAEVLRTEFSIPIVIQ